MARSSSGDLRSVAPTIAGVLLTVAAGLAVGLFRERPMLRILWQERQEKKRAAAGEGGS